MCKRLSVKLMVLCFALLTAVSLPAKSSSADKQAKSLAKQALKEMKIQDKAILKTEKEELKKAFTRSSTKNERALSGFDETAYLKAKLSALQSADTEWGDSRDAFNAQLAEYLAGSRNFGSPNGDFGQYFDSSYYMEIDKTNDSLFSAGKVPSETQTHVSGDYKYKDKTSFVTYTFEPPDMNGSYVSMTNNWIPQVNGLAVTTVTYMSHGKSTYTTGGYLLGSGFPEGTGAPALTVDVDPNPDDSVPQVESSQTYTPTEFPNVPGTWTAEFGTYGYVPSGNYITTTRLNGQNVSWDVFTLPSSDENYSPEIKQSYKNANEVAKNTTSNASSALKEDSQTTLGLISDEFDSFNFNTPENVTSTCQTINQHYYDFTAGVNEQSSSVQYDCSQALTDNSIYDGGAQFDAYGKGAVAKFNQTVTKTIDSFQKKILGMLKKLAKTAAKQGKNIVGVFVPQRLWPAAPRYNGGYAPSDALSQCGVTSVWAYNNGASPNDTTLMVFGSGVSVTDIDRPTIEVYNHTGIWATSGVGVPISGTTNQWKFETSGLDPGYYLILATYGDQPTRQASVTVPGTGD